MDHYIYHWQDQIHYVIMLSYLKGLAGQKEAFFSLQSIISSYNKLMPQAFKLYCSHGAIMAIYT